MNNRFRRLCRAVVFPIALAAGTGCGGQSVTGGGLAVSGPAEHEFGECRQGDVLTHTFSLTKTEKTPIQIVQLTTSCGCFRVGNARDLRTKPVAPGETVPLTINF